MAKIYIKGARQNNLKDVTISIDHAAITCVSGPSGAGKSSLVFDVIYSQAQRRYIETFSPYARQFLERLPQPDLDSIVNLPAAIAVGQTNPVRNSRSTVATLSELTYFTRMLFFKNSKAWCPECELPVEGASWIDIWQKIKNAEREGLKKAWLCARVKPDRMDKLVRDGYVRIILDGNEMDITRNDVIRQLATAKKDYIDLVIDRFLIPSIRQERLRESTDRAFVMGEGALKLRLEDGTVIHFSKKPRCPGCGKTFSKPGPHLFSFNSPQGACQKCKGFGRVTDIDWDLVIPDRNLSIASGAIKPLENWQDEKRQLLEWCKSTGLDPNVPWKNLEQRQRDAVIFGSGTWFGIKAIFNWLETKRYKPHVRILLSRYRAYLQCPSCNGTRFQPLTLCYRLAGVSIADFYSMNARKALDWCRDVRKHQALDRAAESLLNEMERRLALINNAGLGYLSLNRQSRTLSGGELSRLCLTQAISTDLSSTLFCLDEPSAGLHPKDVSALGDILQDLRDAGNTIIVVENDAQIRRISDCVIELGPGSGASGGSVVKTGPPAKYTECGNVSEQNPMDTERTLPGYKSDHFSKFLEVKGACANNLKAVSCRIPKAAITCVCGVSGSGKSSLVEECLFRGILRLKGTACAPPGKFEKILGWDDLAKVRLVDQEPVSRNPRACPGTFLKMIDAVRKLMASTEQARAAQIKPGYFSTNIPGGRCEDCLGQGVERIEMQFLPDLIIPCAYCQGKRFSQAALEYEYRGKNISDILHMTIEEASDFFDDCRPFQKAARPAIDLGLGYLLLGQPLNTLSAGEAQRLKIARSLLPGPRDENFLFILDEPTRGLHFRETKRLIAQLKMLAQKGHTVLVVEHDLEVLKASDWVIELGPGGGEKGGEKIYEGPPALLFENASTPTARFLASCNIPVHKNDKEQNVQEEETPYRSNPGARPPINIRGARHHNLKDINISIPADKFVVITGVSGSGKSSLAFDLIHREAQRRYLESLPSYMKQFVRLHERFDVDSITGLSPSVAIEQKVSRGGAMSTVATLTETANYLRLVFANLSTPVCPECKRKMKNAQAREILDIFMHMVKSQDVLLISPRIRSRKGWHLPEIQKGFSAGASMVRADGKFYTSGEKVALSRFREHDVDWVWGPAHKGSCDKGALKNMLETALKAGSGQVSFVSPNGREKVMSLRYFCPECLVSVRDPDPLLFSFHTSSGRCPACNGRGLDQSGRICKSCSGTRLSRLARIWKIDNLSIDQIFAMEALEVKERLEQWIATGIFPESKREMAEMLLDPVIERLDLLSELGLDYLPLDRAGNTLSGGESQRIRLAVQAGSNLTGLTIVLDEPTIGLHPSDNRRLISTLKRLRDKGNTVVVVEHDEETIRSADWIIDMGPGGGRTGGQIIAQGSLEQIAGNEDSRTAIALKKKKEFVQDSSPVLGIDGWLEFRGINQFNLRNIDIKIPTGALTVISGVSGSGKSTLLNEVIWPAFSTDKKSDFVVSGKEYISQALRIDHSPIGRTSRSCPATFSGIWTDIRFLFSRTRHARIRGYEPGHFSFNTKDGRCETCSGQGVLCEKLSFLPDVFVTCEECQGKRFKQEILDVKWKDKDISQVLEMSVDEALEFFRAVPKLRRRLGFMQELGLGYLTLGQPSPWLSGGESQRLKLAAELFRPCRNNVIYLLDEPTVGLHMEDVERLSASLKKLTDAGNTVVVVEHNLDFMKGADWFIDLGPGGGRKGGRVLFQGTAREFLKESGTSRTAAELRRFISKT